MASGLKTLWTCIFCKSALLTWLLASLTYKEALAPSLWQGGLQFLLITRRGCNDVGRYLPQWWKVRGHDTYRDLWSGRVCGMLSSLCLCFCGNLLLPPSEQTEILQTWYQNTSFVPQKDHTYFIISRYWDIKWFICDTCPWFWSTKSIFYRRQFQEILMFLRDPVIELGKLVSVHWRTVINGIFSMCWNILSLIWD